MTEPMSISDCRAAQRACSSQSREALDGLRIELKEDIAALREAVQGIDRAVAQIKGYLGINGQAPQRRKDDSLTAIESMHKRIDDIIKSHEDTIVELRTRSTDGVTLPRWMVYGSAVLLLLIVILAAVAGERAIPALLSGLREVP